MQSAERFSDRVDDYVRYRPSYPPEVLETLITECGLKPDWTIADIGSGTGILARILLENGNRVIGVEPGAKMREAAEQSLSQFDRFQSVNGSAENTSLPDHSVDLITAAQAFHWFDRPRARAEFARILKPHGWVAIMWNTRDVGSTRFSRDYDALLLKYGRDYQHVDHRLITDEVIAEFFAPSIFSKRLYDNTIFHDLDGLLGRLRSSSYVPLAGDPNHQPLIDAVTDLFHRHASEGRVPARHETRIYFGQLD